MAHRTGPTLRLTPADRDALEALQAFSNERTATRAIGIAVQHYPDTCRALENAETDRDQARRALEQILDALDKVENPQFRPLSAFSARAGKIRPRYIAAKRFK